jgi:hypothetical protein
MAAEALAVRTILHCNNNTEEKALLQFHGNAFNIIVLSATYVAQQLLFHGSSGYANAPHCCIVHTLLAFFNANTISR